MSARILVVDDIPANVRLLEARLTAEYFDVVTAASGPEAIDICERSQCDIVLLDVMMAGMDGFEVCRRLKDNPATSHIPVVMVTALDQPADRVRGLQAGADDFLTKPVNDVALLARVRSLVRLKAVTDELRLRASSSRELGMGDPVAEALAEDGLGGRVLLVDDRPGSLDRLSQSLVADHHVDVENSPQDGLFRAAEGDYELAIVSLDFSDYDGLRLCSQIRSLDRTRRLPILVVADGQDMSRVARALEIGVNDYVLVPVDRNELAARARTQIRRKRYAERLRQNVQQSLEMAITDTLTGLYNRRYFELHAGGIVEQAGHRGQPVSLLVLDIDHFKSVNDTFGHDAGDDVLREFSRRVRRNLRGIDLLCRTGGEEFVIVMPDTEIAVALAVAERIRRRVERDLFRIRDGSRSVPVTVSIGASAYSDGDGIGALLKRADEALYRAKRSGRNRVAVDAA